MRGFVCKGRSFARQRGKKKRGEDRADEEITPNGGKTEGDKSWHIIYLPRKEGDVRRTNSRGSRLRRKLRARVRPKED